MCRAKLKLCIWVRVNNGVTEQIVSQSQKKIYEYIVCTRVLEKKIEVAVGLINS